MKTLREYIDLVDGKIDEGMAEYDRRRKLQSQISKIESIDFYITDDDGLIIAGPFEGRSDATEAFERLVRQRQDINIIQGRALIVKLAGMRESVAEGDSGDYDYPYTMSARDKGRYDAMTGREYNNPYSAFGTQEDHNNAIEYSAAYDNAKEQDVTEEEAQEYTVRVVDEEGSGYTVKVTATSEQGALHKAIVKVRNSGARPEHARIIRQDVEEQATPEAIARIEQLSSK